MKKLNLNVFKVLNLKNAVLGFSLFAATSTGFAQEKPWFNSKLGMDARIDALLKEMTLEEKISQTVNESAAIDRLGIPKYDWWSEALHGVARSGKATVFPQAIGLAATFDPILMQKVGDAVSDEARAINNHLLNNGYTQRLYQGLTFWSPNVNIFRDPRWGRGQETFGEDPLLSGTIGAAYIKGLQGSNPKYLKVAACAKHFAVHSGPEALRHEFNAIANAKDLRETYLPQFKMCVDAGVEAVMCAYNRTNNEACCGSNYLLQDVLLDEWKFKGHIVSDCGALDNFHKKHGLTANSAESAALALKRGVDINCGDTYTKSLKEAFDKKLITMADLDTRLKRSLKTRFSLGMFDDATANPYRAIGPEVINDAAKKKLALETGQKSIVMLKNNGALPLDKNSRILFMTGPLANDALSLVGNYNGVSGDFRSVAEGIASKVSPSTAMEFRQGALLTTENKNKMDWFSGHAKEADATIVTLGLTLLLEGEEGESLASPNLGDMLDMKLPESQLVLLRKISEKAHSNGKKVITVICAGMPLDMREVTALSDAVLYAWYPGERGGDAVADIVFGDVSPSAKLPITFPKSIDQLPPFEDYSMKGRTYKYMTETPLYPFGFGLSYAKLEWASPSVSKATLKKNQNLQFDITIKNVGTFDADEVAQVYLSIDNKVEQVPISSLVSFKRAIIKKGENTTVSFSIPYSDFAYINSKGDKVQHKGKATITVGNASPGQRSQELGAKSFKIEVDVK
jgi:beta-glucosidase